MQYGAPDKSIGGTAQNPHSDDQSRMDHNASGNIWSLSGRIRQLEQELCVRR